MADIGFRVLGPLEVHVDDHVVAVEAPRLRTILAVLLLSAPRAVPTQDLVVAVWGDEPPVTARGQVQNCISALRRRLGGAACIQTTGVGYALDVPASTVDALGFESLLTIGREAVASGRLDEAADHLRTALRMWRGQALVGVSGATIEFAAARLEELKISATEELIEIELDLGRHFELVGELGALVAAHPLRERLRGFLMLALYRCGRQVEALETYRAARRQLIDDLGLEPGEALRQLEQAILTRNASLELDGGPARTRPSAGAHGPDVRPLQLPPDIGDFTGRASLVEQLVAELVGDAQPFAAPIRVITGLGGVGKTALAVHVGHRIKGAFADGQLFVDLHGSQQRPSDPCDVLGRFLRALGVAPAEIGTGLDERCEKYRTMLANRRLLVVLDDAADESQVAPLLPGGPGNAVVVTSRLRFGALPGARMVEADVLDRDESVALLSEIVGRQRVAQEAAPLDRLVALCGGLPLALRIVGARLAARPHWRLQTIVDRLTDERRRLDELAYGELDVRAAMSLTYCGLSELGKRLLRQLSVVDAPHFAAWTCVALLARDPAAVASAIDELIDVRLLEVAADHDVAPRYHLHDLVRAFARERLRAEESEAEQTSALIRFVSGCLTIAEEAHRRIYGGDYTVLHGTGQRWQVDTGYVDSLMTEPLSFLDTERQTLLAATKQACDAGLDELCWDLAVTSVTLFEARGYYDDWRTTHEMAVSAARRAGNLRGEAIALCSLSSLGGAVRDPDDRYRLRRALHLFRRLGETLGEALTLRNVANLDRVSGDFDEAVRSYELALAGFRSAGDRVGEAHVLANLAQVHLDRADVAQAEPLLQDALAMARKAGNARVAAQISFRLGGLLLLQHRPVDAAETFHEVLEAVRRVGDRVGEIYSMTGLGQAYTEIRRYRLAEQLLTDAEELCQRFGGRQVKARVLLALGRVRMATRDLSRAEDHLRQAAALFGAQQARYWQAQALDALGEVHALTGHLAAASDAWTEASLLATAPAKAEDIVPVAADTLRCAGPVRSQGVSPIVAAEPAPRT